ncbi:MAG: hypothetical protein JWN56_2264 [Sphingobacteriales bacterium]|nr:hypothetical protein [Sphingobacteriales bacterium]
MKVKNVNDMKIIVSEILFIKSAIRSTLFVSFYMVVSLLFSNCTKNLQKEEVVYKNDFEKGDLSGIIGGKIFTFNNSKVLGNFNNSGFDCKINNIGSHDYVEVSFNLYIHDQWMGNSVDGTTTVEPDVWQMKIEGNTYLNTTFSNTDSQQSYPDNYQVNNPAKANSFHSYLLGMCNGSDNTFGTSMYKIVKTVKSSNSSFVFECRDILGNLNAVNEHCKSWSIDNLAIKTIKFR